jgi:UPF0716 protein FxsA
MRLILLILLLMPFVELYLLLQIAEWTSALWTIAWILATGVAGVAVARWQGLSMVRQIQYEINQGRVPATTVLDALLVLVAGVLLVTPGVLADLCGLMLLVPLTRRFVRQALIRWLRRRTIVATGEQTGDVGRRFARRSGQPPGSDHTAASGQVIDSYVVSRNEQEKSS